MHKRNTMTEPENESHYISDMWSTKCDGVISAQREGLNWLFTLNIGGVAGMLTYATSADITRATLIAFLSFSLGLLVLIVYATIYYYSEERSFRGFKDDVIKFNNSEISFSTLVKNEDDRPDKYYTCEYLAWFSAVLAVVGTISSAVAILL